MDLPCFMSFCKTYGLAQPRRFGDKQMAACFSKVVIGKRKVLRFERFCEAIRAAAVVLDVAYADLVRRMARRLPGQSPRRAASIEDSIEEKFDAVSGRGYYLNTRTGRTGWRRADVISAVPAITEDVRFRGASSASNSSQSR